MKGEWQGKLAASLGLNRRSLAAGVLPAFRRDSPADRGTDGQAPPRARSTQNADGTTTKAVEHRAGWDATFSAPKSVSLTALVGGDERVREAHRAAVTTALDELERYTHARIGGNNPAETYGHSSSPPSSSMTPLARWTATPHRSSTRMPSSSM